MNASSQEQNTNGNPPQSTQESAPPPTYHDWREQRRAEHLARREARWQRHARRPYGWIGGVILILVGVVFLLQNMGIPFLMNWWALFILIPAFWGFVAAWDVYQNNGYLTRAGISSLTVGILLTMLAFVFLLNLYGGLFWPVLLIVGGLVLLGTAFFPR